MDKMKGEVKSVFSREGFSKFVTYLRERFPRVEKRNLLLFACMAAIVASAVSIRMLPLKWGFSLSEFDPYFQYDVTRYIVENGLFSWHGWHMDNMWFPQGRYVDGTSFPAFPMTGAVLYSLISSLGIRVSVMDVCIVFPVIFAAIACIVAYYLGKDVGGRGVGLLSAFFLAVNPAYISRTALGFYDDETVGILGILLTSLFYLRSLKHDEKWQVSLAYSAAAGVSLGYVFASWGASRYLLALLALYSFILFLAKMYSRRLLVSYGVLMTVGLSIAVLVPKLGFSFITEFECIAAIGVFLFLAVYELSQRFSEQWRKPFMASMFVGLGGIALVLWQIGFISLPVAKFISVINPFERITMPLIESVQEHRPATWSAFYYQFGVLVFMAPIGIIFALQRATNEKMFILTFALTTLYFSASMIRLTVLAAPALCILGALAIVEIVRPFSDIARQRVFTRRRRRLYPGVGTTFSVLLMVVLFLLTLLPLGRGIDSAYSPTTIASSSLPVRANVGDWLESLTWMRETLPERAVVASWWDYGYWISVLGNRTSLSDNGTFNGTQIAWIGKMFMSTEDDAINMIQDFNQYARRQYSLNNNISYVVVFTTIGLASSGQNLWGDEVKWRWMAKIGWNNIADKPLEDLSITKQLADYWTTQTQDTSLQQWYSEFGQTVYLPKADRVLTKLMIYGTFGPGLLPEDPQRFQLVHSSSNHFVFVYKVLY